MAWVEAGDVAIPEIQRPFVWNQTQVRDLMDSLYQGYPVGYIITWQNPTIKLKDGSSAAGKRVMIDGQQRITALRAAIAGLPVVTKKYAHKRIIISFNPQTEEFATQSASIRNNSAWISDMSECMSVSFDIFSFVKRYCEKNSNADPGLISARVYNLIQIKNKQIGEIQLSPSLDIELVNEIFVRINSSGVTLSNADFAMSKVAVYEREPGDGFGMRLRKFIDYFCNLAVAPAQIDYIKANDSDFAMTDYFKQISWLGKDTDSVYDPTYGDILRVVALTHFNRGRLSDLVALLSGRDFEKHANFQEIADDSFARLEAGVYFFTNQNRFKHFVQDILCGAGFDGPGMITARNAVNYAYAMYLRLHDIGENPSLTIRLVRKLFVLSLLTGRHSGSFETRFEADIRAVTKLGDMASFVATLERDTLSETYWTSTLPDEFNKVRLSSPYWFLFVAAQKKLGCDSFLTDAKLFSLTTGDVHHIFPKHYLIKHGFKENDYNRIANFVYLRNDVNVRIGDSEPQQYVQKIIAHPGAYGSLVMGREALLKNFADNAVPEMLESATYQEYETFMAERRVLMARVVERYYGQL